MKESGQVELGMDSWTDRCQQAQLEENVGWSQMDTSIGHVLQLSCLLMALNRLHPSVQVCAGEHEVS